MVSTLIIRNFRGIQKADIQLAPITVLIGPNNAGKSTIIYALLTLKNIVVNPNQPLDSFFNLSFLNLGGFKQAVFVKDETLRMDLGVEARTDGVGGHYGIALAKNTGAFHIQMKSPFTLRMDLDVTFPYALNSNGSGLFEYEGRSYQVTWNGLAATVASTESQADPIPSEISSAISALPEEIRRIDMVPLRRGFSKPVYAAVPVPAQLFSEDEIATVLATDSDLLGRVDLSLERILNRSLRLFTPPNTASFYLQTMNRETGMMSELVNEGFGTNQLVYLLAKIYREGAGLVCVEEPEIHLHPSAIGNLMREVVQVTKHRLAVRRRHFLFSTHSEHLVTSLLALVAKGELAVEDVALYYVSRRQDDSIVERCEISKKGQVKGGLRGFYDVELAAIRELLQAEGDE